MASTDCIRSEGGRTMAKEIFVAYGIDVDAVAGWLGSYGGAGFALRHHPRPVRRRGRLAAAAAAVREMGDQDDLVHPRPFDRDLSRPDEDGRRRRPRDRHARLQPREPGGDDARAGRGDLRQVHRGDHKARGQAAARLRRAVVGARAEHGGAAPQEGPQIRPLDDEQRLPPLLCPGGRFVDEDRLFQAPIGLDEAAGARQGDRPRSTSRPPGTSTTCRR